MGEKFPSLHFLLHYLHGPLLDPLQNVTVSLALGSPELEPTTDVASTGLCRREVNPQPTGSTLSESGRNHTLSSQQGLVAGSSLTPCPPGPPGPFLPSCFPAGGPPEILVQGAAPPQLQDLALLLDEALKFLSGHLSSMLRSFWKAVWSSGLSSFTFSSVVSANLLCPITQVSNEAVEQDWTQL